ncbi:MULTISPECIES: DUF4019 domain-containing protein [unclassified Herbaspirillum]|uniref:DUF4019 domain-containing protein n=2 Tax=unclassified Herbaspirillum TaxID=2624150 RepID=UPI00114EFCC1|nr:MULTISPECIES: DUF4019 domain-containing protein [unclassified Herbaspirillum]TQK03729.1 uncharacterized protein DUF4019 [Herbaspirillum sp. SJZ130]TQK08461.1 uncharacterized protein DUF4019 [Herbaspirillum sp. SJZ106]TWC71726.1 uncharacterized protein DUF4019 [Herbaspirillum sp. SJZ099]
MASYQSLKKSACIAAFSLGAIMSAHQAAAQSTASIDTAVAAATRWAVLADANQADRMWSLSGPIMQKGVSKEDWVKYLAALHSELGSAGGREWVQIVRINNPANLPPGEYVNVVFASRFAKSPTVEKVSMVQTADRWTPVGYVVTRLESSPAPGAAAPAAR